MFNLTLVVAGLKELVIEDLGGTVRDASLFFSVETFAYIIFAPVWGAVSDRLGRRKPFVVIGFLGSALIYAYYGVVDSVGLLLALRFVQGALTVMGWSLVMAHMMDQPGIGSRGRYMGLMGASLILGVALGAPVGGYITKWFGARAPLAAAAMLFGLLTLMSLLLRESGRKRGGARLDEITTLIKRQPRLLLPYGVHFIDRLAVGLFVVIFPLYLDSLGAGDAAVRGRYLSGFLVPFAFLQFFTGRWCERIGPVRPLIYGSLLYGLLLGTIGITPLQWLGASMVGLGMLAAVMFPPAILLTSQLSSDRTRGSAVGGFNLAGSLGFALGPLLGAWAYEARGFGFAFALCGLSEIVLALVAWWAFRGWQQGRAASGGHAD
jgi:MFS family permease